MKINQLPLTKGRAYAMRLKAERRRKRSRWTCQKCALHHYPLVERMNLKNAYRATFAAFLLLFLWLGYLALDVKDGCWWPSA